MRRIIRIHATGIVIERTVGGYRRIDVARQEARFQAPQIDVGVHKAAMAEAEKESKPSPSVNACRPELSLTWVLDLVNLDHDTGLLQPRDDSQH
jgi:hypothetical protein